ncbi:MAG: hypothetical protein LBD58_06530 [Treponema sp.]|jgi:hypothetical protein|nr:hypothetical protein [Treponema sp.]
MANGSEAADGVKLGVVHFSSLLKTPMGPGYEPPRPFLLDKPSAFSHYSTVYFKGSEAGGAMPRILRYPVTVIASERER